MLATILGPVLASWPTPLRLALLIPSTVAALVWIVMPFLIRRFGSWLGR
ncbi:hypothetical protein [Nocardia sp. NPDC051981]